MLFFFFTARVRNFYLAPMKHLHSNKSDVLIFYDAISFIAMLGDIFGLEVVFFIMISSRNDALRLEKLATWMECFY